MRLTTIGLRARLVLAFAVVALVTGAAAVLLADVTFQQYRDAVRYGAAFSRADLLRLLALTVLTLLALVVALALVAAATVLRPVRGLVSATEAMARGDLRVRLRVRGDDEIARLTDGFNRMAGSVSRGVEDLRRAEARSRRFAADVAHELRTPLAAMTAVTDVLEEEAGALSGRGPEAARLVVRETRHLTRLVEDLTEMARFDASTAALRRQDVDIAAVVRHCLELRGWSGRVAVDAPASLCWQVDPARFEVVVANLVGNALQHGAPPVTVAVRALPPGPQDPARLVLEVHDSGPGLPADVLPHVFERFFKGDVARGRSEGSGLGLALARENAQLHGGALDVVDPGGPGTTFRLVLPAVTNL